MVKNGFEYTGFKLNVYLSNRNTDKLAPVISVC